MGTNARILISLTTIPHRMGSSLVQTLDALTASGHDVLLSVPREYRKWGIPDVPATLIRRPGVTIHRPSEDFGPATKLLGALDWLTSQGDHDFTHIVTSDDDCWYADPAVPIAELLAAERAHPGPVAVTFGGIRLVHPPYRNDDGLAYDNDGYVDAVAGFRGVLYPLAAVWPHRDTLLTLRHQLPEGIFHDDDAYFGMALARCGVPLLAIPVSGVELVFADSAGPSGVETGTDSPRKDNEMRLFQFAVDRGILPNPFTPRPSLLGRLVLALPLHRLRSMTPAGVVHFVRSLGLNRARFTGANRRTHGRSEE